MGLPVTFGPLTAAQMSQLDSNFQAVGALTTVQCTATGTNAIVLTPVANQPVVSAYGLPYPVKFGFTAAASSTGNVTLEVGSLGFLPVYTQAGVQATTSTLANGNYYEVVYTTGSIYNSGSGAWVLTGYQAGSVTPLSAAAVRGLKMTNNAGTPNTQIDVSAQQALMVSATGTPVWVGSSSATCDLTTGTVTSTANGMDGESRPASGWVYIYAISSGSNFRTLGTTTLPLSGPPTLPAGYLYYAYLGAMYCNGSSNLMGTRQLGGRSDYVVGLGVTTVIPNIANGTAGTYSATTPTYAAASVSAFVPPTAGVIFVAAGTNYNNASQSAMLLAPNNSYSGGSTTNPPPWFSTSGQYGATVPLVLESTNIYWASSANGGGLSCLGWTDYVSAAGG